QFATEACIRAWPFLDSQKGGRGRGEPAGRRAIMPTVKEILGRKGKGVLTTGPDTTVLDAALLMNEHKVGSLLVTESGRVVGIFTERDVLTRVVVGRRDPAT